MKMSESAVEAAALAWFAGIGYKIAHGPDIAPNSPCEERADYGAMVLEGRLRNALSMINPKIPAPTLEEVVRKVARPDSPNLVADNRAFHRLITDGVPVEYRTKDGAVKHDLVQLFDFRHTGRNDWLVVNQFTVQEGTATRRPDLVVFVNGLPLAVLELKDAASKSATLDKAYGQLQTYKREIPTLFRFNAALVVSDGMRARMGTLTAGWDRFQPWRTINGDERAPSGQAELQVVIEGAFAPERFLDLVRHFVVFEDDGETVVKKMAAYHQFHAVNKAVEATVAAAAKDGDGKAGVVWHTQGSGKSLTMAFYAGKIIQRLDNPTVVVLTDRNDLDQQLFDTFSHCSELMRQTPVQVEGRDDLKAKLDVASGGVVFTTIQKFLPDPGKRYPEISTRHNIVFIADEAHRSQYGFRPKLHVDKRSKKTTLSAGGFAQHVRDAFPNASFIGFTGTPIETADHNIRNVFGNYIDKYDIHRAIEDGATVPIYYSARLIKLELDDELKQTLDDEAEEVTEDEEPTERERLKSKWARLEALVGADDRVKLIAADIVQHFEERLAVMDGKGMVVCMSRRICVDLHDAIVKLRPEWFDADDGKGVVKVIMTGNASETDWQPHIRTKNRRRKLAERFRDAADPFRLVIVRDMWLTGFDAPCLHTMYIDKPMHGLGLMQAIARVNRVFKDKPGGLVVDYLGIGDQLKKALAQFTAAGHPAGEDVDRPQEMAVRLMKEKHEVVAAMFHGFDHRRFYTAAPSEQLNILKSAAEHILTLDGHESDDSDCGRKDGVERDSRRRFVVAVDALSKAYALSVPHPDVKALDGDVAFFQAVRATLMKYALPDEGGEEGGGGVQDAAIRQLVSKAITTDRIIDVFRETGMDKPDISILSDEFLAEVQGMPQRNLAMEALKKLLNDEIRLRERRNLIEARHFSEMLKEAIRRYHNRAIDTAQVIQELIELAKQFRDSIRRGEDLGMSEEELAFYDALALNDSTVQAMGDDTLKDIARELVKTVRANVSIDWTQKESVKANLRRMVRRILKKYGYPPDRQEDATLIVIKQAESFGDALAE
ncbi:type I restriction enzyme R subunit [Azospirillum sp. OGB3]|uniref:type I restriction endonuclease subunit R n=1 Tax=Azospirillum sp. OGB3 TaxID=2587012 RepID=UPI00181E3BE7|nr:type I restriction endonuclease subunit R [Azospirillum sp. OGB3]MBB3267609.1 type I restriction enzyme R subunit [Azospirillum sp. OGB3]